MTEAETKSDTGLTQGPNRRSKAKKRLYIAVGVVLAIAVLPPIVVPMAKPWTEINCRHQDINIKTGQARYSRYLWYVKISEVVKDTPISVALGGKVMDVADVEPWRRVNTFSPGLRHSPHYHYHGALHQARELDLISELNELGTEEKREIAENILELWQTERGYFPVNDYLQTVLIEGANISDQK